MLDYISIFSLWRGILFTFLLVTLITELLHRLRSTSPLKISFLNWKINYIRDGVTIEGYLKISNPHKYMEVMVPELKVLPTLLSQNNLSILKIQTQIIPEHPEELSRHDNYWASYIVKGYKSTYVQLKIYIGMTNRKNFTNYLSSLWLDIYWINYGPFGYLCRREGIGIPLNHPKPILYENANWYQGKYFQVLPIRTHLLGPLDDLLSVIEHYAGNLLEPGDIITIGETPLAVIQGRFHHPTMVKISTLARLLCRFFHPTSSLATACGLQVLIDIVGPSRVLVAWLMGSIFKVLGFKGVFYHLAGNQARLIDDITGTTPPYDQTIVLGPYNAKQICHQLSQKLKIAIAIVDVNDLGRVKILGKSILCDENLLQDALRLNPAGNANEHTPLVLIRPNS